MRQRATPNRVEAVLKYAVGPKVLDVGCSGQQGLRSDFTSPWWLHRSLCDHFPEVWGLEYVDENVEAMRQAGFNQVVQGDAEDFNLDTRFNTVVAGELIEHLANPGAFLKSVADHLDPDGRLVLTTPYAFSLISVLYAWFKYPKTCSNEEHTLWLCPTTCERLLAQAGLSVQTIEIVDDYRRDLSSRVYRRLLPIYLLFRRLLPVRMGGNTMVIVATIRE